MVNHRILVHNTIFLFQDLENHTSARGSFRQFSTNVPPSPQTGHTEVHIPYSGNIFLQPNRRAQFKFQMTESKSVPCGVVSQSLFNLQHSSHMATE